jgi:hypothetical protein
MLTSISEIHPDVVVTAVRSSNQHPSELKEALKESRTKGFDMYMSADSWSIDKVIDHNLKELFSCSGVTHVKDGMSIKNGFTYPDLLCIEVSVYPPVFSFLNRFRKPVPSEFGGFKTRIVAPLVNELESSNTKIVINDADKKKFENVVASFLCAILMLIYHIYMLMILYGIYMRFSVFWNCMAGVGFLILIHNSGLGHLVARFLFYAFCIYYMYTYTYIETC